MNVVAVVEGLAWLISAALAVWMVLDMVRVARRHGGQALVDAPDPLEEPDLTPAADGPESGRTS